MQKQRNFGTDEAPKSKSRYRGDADAQAAAQKGRDAMADLDDVLERAGRKVQKSTLAKRGCCGCC